MQEPAWIHIFIYGVDMFVVTAWIMVSVLYKVTKVCASDPPSTKGYTDTKNLYFEKKPNFT